MTNDTHLIYGYTPIEITTPIDILQALAPVHSMYPGDANRTDEHASEQGRGRLLQGLKVGKVDQRNKVRKSSSEDGLWRENFSGKGILSGDVENSQAGVSGSVSRRRKLLSEDDSKPDSDNKPVEGQKKTQKKKTSEKKEDTKEEIDGMDAFYKEPQVNSEKKFTGPGLLTITNSNGIQLSPSTLRPYSLYKLTISRPFDTVYICYQSVVKTDTLVRLAYRFRDQSLFQEMPSKNDSSDLMAKINKVEQNFMDALKNYQELQTFEERFVSTSGETLTSFMTMSQILLLCYLIVTWLLKVIIEKTIRYKKII